MKKLLLALLFVSVAAFAQTAEETRAWVLSKVLYNYGLKYSFDGDDMISLILGQYGGSTHKRTLPIKSIKTISYLHTNKFLSFTLKWDDEFANLKFANLIATDDRDKFGSEAKKDAMIC